MECVADSFFEAVSEMQNILQNLMDVQLPSSATLPNTAFDGLCNDCAPASSSSILDEVPDDTNIFYFAPIDFRPYEQCKVSSILSFPDVDKKFFAFKWHTFTGHKKKRATKAKVPEEIRATDKYKMYRQKNTAAAKRYRWQRKLEKLTQKRAELRLEVMSLTEERNLLVSTLRRRIALRLV